MSDFTQGVAAGALFMNSIPTPFGRSYNNSANEWKIYARSLEARINDLEQRLLVKTCLVEVVRKDRDNYINYLLMQCQDKT